MSKIYSKKQVLSTQYIAATDPGAGAVGTVQLGIYIPKYCTATGIQITVLEDLTSATSLAKISFGYRTLDGGANSIILFPATVITTVNTAGTIYDIQTSPLRLTVDWELIMAISVEDLDGGNLIAAVHYTEFQF